MCKGKYRGNRFYRYGEEGHIASGYQTERGKCALCTALGRPAEHKLNGDRCHQECSGMDEKRRQTTGATADHGNGQ